MSILKLLYAFLLFLLFEMGSCCVALADLEFYEDLAPTHRDPLIFGSQGLGLKAHTTVLSL